MLKQTMEFGLLIQNAIQNFSQLLMKKFRIESKQPIDSVLIALLILLIIVSGWWTFGVGYFVFLLLKCQDKGNFEYFIYAFGSLLSSLPFCVGVLVLGVTLRKKVAKFMFIGSIIPSTLMVIYALLIFSNSLF